MPNTSLITDQREIALTIDQLALSPWNVRTHRQDAESTEGLESLLLIEGQRVAINCHPMQGRKNLWGVHAGGRRYRSFRNLIARGELPADHQIRAISRVGWSVAQLLEESMRENMPRRDLRDYEMYAGVVKIAKTGEPAEAIAESLGQSIDWVKGCLRLGDVAEPVFKAFADGHLSHEQLRAFGATGDKGLQLAVWQEIGGANDDNLRKPARIRAAMKIGDAQLGRLMRLVGELDYVAAGGRIEPDMFADPADPRDRICDEPILRDLAERRIEDHKTEVRKRLGRPDMRFVNDPPRGQYGTDYGLAVHPKDDGAGGETVPAGEIVARLFIDEKGDPVVDYWWASRSAKHAGSRSAGSAQRPVSDAAVQAETLRPAAAIGQQYDNARQVADAAIREEEGLSAESVQILRSTRRQILRGLLVDDAEDGGTIGTDYLVWSQLRLVLDMDARPSQVGVGHSVAAEHDPAYADEHVRAMPATEKWRDAIGELSKQSFVTGEDLSAAFSDYVASPTRLKDLAGAIVAGIALQRSLFADGYVVPVHDQLARHLGVHPLDHDTQVRRYWTPTEPLMARFPTRQAMAIAEPFVEPDAFGAWSKAKAAEVTRRLTHIVTGQRVPGLRADRAGAASEWVHPLLRFTRIGPEVDASASAEIREAAE